MTCKKWLRPLGIAALITAALAVYVGFFQHSPRGFFAALADAMFLWGLTLLCISLVYVTRFFGFLPVLKMWARFRPFHPQTEEDNQPLPATDSTTGKDQDKRDKSLVYASLLLILLSIPIYYL